MNKKSFVIKSSESKEFPISCDYSYKEENPKIVIFCHGFKGFKDWGCWNLVANYFVNNGLNFLKFNFSQNGTTLDNVNQISDFKSFRNNNYSIELQDLIRVINHIKSPKSLVKCNDLYLIGHSRGGGIACLATQYHPEIAKLVTWASVADFKERFPAKNELLKWKREIIKSNNLGNLLNSSDDSVSSADIVDQASSYTDKSVEMKALNRSRKLISKINSALQRIKAGTYGYCEETGEPIGLKRLMARPVATLSIEAQEKHERDEKIFVDD